MCDCKQLPLLTSDEILNKLDELCKESEKVILNLQEMNKVIEQRKSLPWIFRVFT